MRATKGALEGLHTALGMKQPTDEALTLEVVKVDAEDVTIQIGNNTYKYKPTGLTSEELAHKVGKMAMFSPGKAVQWLKKNASIVQAPTEGDEVWDTHAVEGYRRKAKRSKMAPYPQADRMAEPASAAPVAGTGAAGVAAGESIQSESEYVQCNICGSMIMKPEKACPCAVCGNPWDAKR